MKRLFCIFLLAFTTAVLQAQQDSDRAAVSKVLTLERAKLQALQVRDLNALNEILDEQFVCVDEQGKILTRSLMLISLQTSDSASYLAGEMDVRVHGNTAVVTGIYQWKRKINGKGVTKQVRFIDTWVQRQGAWTALATLLTPAT